MLQAGLFQVLFPDLQITKPQLNIPNNELVVTAHLLSKNSPEEIIKVLTKVGWDRSAVIKIAYLVKLSQWAKGQEQWQPEFIHSPIDIDHQ